MEQGTIVAVVSLTGSFLTIAVTAGVNIWTKIIDNKQKINDHKLAIRSLYINKKIEAGQVLISNNNIKINSLNLVAEYWIRVQTIFDRDEKLFDKIAKTEESIRDLKLTSSDWTPLYFDLDDFYNQAYEFTKELNILFKDYDEEYNSPSCTGEEINKILNSILYKVDNLQSVYKQMNKIVRNDLAKYDSI